MVDASFPVVGAIDLQSTERVAHLGETLRVENVGLNVFSFDRGDASRIHRHRRQEEIFLVLRGTLTVQLEIGETYVPRLALVRVAPMVKRQLRNDHEERCIFVALGAANSHVRGDAEAFASWDDPEPRSPRDIPLPRGPG
jgi:quercetin dioxygenase-like cupin family protein